MSRQACCCPSATRSTWESLRHDSRARCPNEVAISCEGIGVLGSCPCVAFGALTVSSARFPKRSSGCSCGYPVRGPFCPESSRTLFRWLVFQCSHSTFDGELTHYSPFNRPVSVCLVALIGFLDWSGLFVSVIFSWFPPNMHPVTTGYCRSEGELALGHKVPVL